MVRWWVRRALAQRRLLAGVVALVVLGTTLLGVCALLLGATQDRAFTRGVLLESTHDVEVDAFLTEVAGSDVPAVREETQAVVRGVLAPVGSSTSSSVQTRMRRLGETGETGDDRFAYLAGDTDLARVAVLVSGRWARSGTGGGGAGGPAEAVVPDTAAEQLGLAVGDTVALGTETGTDPVEAPVTVVVTGTFRPRTRADWEHDTLAGAGYDATWSDGATQGPAYGPFVVDDDALLATGSTVASLQVVGRPVLTAATDASLGRVAGGLGAADRLLSARVGDRVRVSRVASALPQTLDRVRVQQASTSASVEVVLLLGTVAALVALVLAGRLVGAVRDDERRLLVALGCGRRQLVVVAAAEAGLVCVVAAALALPAAALVHSRLTHLPALAAAHLDQAPTLDGALLLAVAVGALLAFLALLTAALGGTAGPDDRAPARLRSRVGTDLVLVVVAAAAWSQVRSGASGTPRDGDLLLTLAPAVVVLALSLLVARWVPALVGLLASRFDRAGSLVVPLGVLQASRRPRPVTATVLLAVVAASAAAGLTLRTTWEHSQVEQADLRVGSDLTLALSVPPTAATTDAVLAAGRGSQAGGAREPVVSPVVSRPIALGRYLGDAGSPPLLVGLPGRLAGDLVRGRSTGAGWGAVGAELAPTDAVDGPVLPTLGAGVVVSGEAPAGSDLQVTPTLVVQDGAGFRAVVEAGAVALDGRPHPAPWLAPPSTAGTVVAMRLHVGRGPGAPPPGRGGGGADEVLPVSIDLALPGTAPTSPTTWDARVLDRSESPARTVAVTQDDSATGVVVHTATQVDPAFLAYADADLLATTFTAPDTLPVAVSQQLADTVGTRVGGELSATVDDVDLALRVVAVVPGVPSAPGRVAVLVDDDALSRVLLAAGSLDPVVDGWWVADPTPGTARALGALDLGEVTTRASALDRLSRGPLRVTTPTALSLLVVAAVVLLLAGVGLLLGADQRRRSAEVARLRALGLSRRATRRLLLVEHATLVVPLVVLGAAVGAVAAYALAPALVRSDTGSAPVPAVSVVWPWTTGTVLVAAMLLGALVVAVVVTARQVRRADPALLRGGDL